MQRETLVARQPILDENQHRVAYELLYRSSQVNEFDSADAATATQLLISNTLLTLGLDRLAGTQKVFVNFDRESLLRGCPAMLPPERVVIEILETVQPDQETIQACRALKEAGYTLALDDMIGVAGYEEFIALADIIKVDFRLASAEQIGELVRLTGRRAMLLAEKVETREEFEQARQLGFRLFQGYFFNRPVIVSGRQIAGLKHSYLRVLEEIGQPETDFARLDEEIRQDPPLGDRLLQFVNSAAFCWKAPVQSTRHAMHLLGEIDVRRMVSLATLGCLAAGKPQQLLVEALVRARFCELVSVHAGLGDRAPEMYLLGLYSLMDAVLDAPMAEVVSQLSLADDMRAALVGAPVTTRGVPDLLAFAFAFQNADWGLLEETAAGLGVSVETVSECYLGAMMWADQILS